MNRDQRNCHYQSLSNTILHEQSPFLSFMPSVQMKPSPKSSTKDLNQQNSTMRNYTSLVIDDSISFAANHSPQRTPNSQKNIMPQRLPSKKLDRTPSTYHHSQSGKSVHGSVSGHLQNSQIIETGRSPGHIYEEIIKILELQNSNLKEQNKFMLTEHKKIVNQNFKLKAQIESLKGYCSLKLEVQKLRQINETYQRLVEELKFILMEEMVAIHQKINFIMSSQEVTSVYNEFEASLKKSSCLLNSEEFELALKEKGQNTDRLAEGENLAEMMCLLDNGEKNDQIGTFETFESISYSNRARQQKSDKSVYDSPTEATFY